MFYLEGQASILKERIKLSDTKDPVFSLLLIIDKIGIQAALGVNYKMPEDNGSIIKVNGIMELAFFFKDANAWYINIGKPEQPITSCVLSIRDSHIGNKQAA